MGKTYSKDEEIIIAQTGSNQAEYSPLESHMQTYVLMMSIIVLLLALFIILYLCYARNMSFPNARLAAERDGEHHTANPIAEPTSCIKLKSVLR